MSNSFHSIFAPSSMGRIVACPGSVQMVAGEPNLETEESREGDAAHWVGQQMLLSRRDNGYEQYKLSEFDYIGKEAPNGVIITEDMFDSALTYYRAVMNIAGDGLIQELHIEEPLMMPEIHESSYGFSDCWLYDPGKKHLHVFDFKNGHLRVDVNNNYQMYAYDLGALKIVTKDDPLLGAGIKITNHIIQPRCYDGEGPINTATIHDVDLRPHVNIMNDRCGIALTDQATLKAGNHCIGCPARYKCPAILGSVAGIVDYVTSPTPVKMSPEGLSYELQLLRNAEKLLKYRMEAVEQDMMSRIHNGIPVPGFSLEQGYGHNKWSVDDQTVINTGKLLGVDLTSEPTVITPAQARKLLERQNMDPNVIESLFHKPPTSMKLKFDDGTKAKKIFSQEKI